MQGCSWTILIEDAVPLPMPLVDAVQEIQIDTSIEEASAFHIRIGVTQTAIGDWSVLDLDPFKPRLPVQIRIQQDPLPPEAVINGFVTDHRVTYADQAGSSTIEVQGLDATVMMNLQERVQSWANLPDSAIAAVIFGRNTIVPQVDPTSPVLIEPEGTTIQRGTDIRFLRRLARRNGFDCYVQPEPLTGIDQGYFQQRTTTGFPQAVLSVNMGEQSNVQDFSVHYDAAQPTSAQATGLDVRTKSPQPALAPTTLEPPMGLEGALLREVEPRLVLPVAPDLPMTAGLQSAVQAATDRSAWAVIAEGTAGLDMPVLRPGGLVSIRGLGKLYNGAYTVTRVRHTLRQGCIYQQRFEARRNALTETGAEDYVEAM
jgi:phage protein D